VPDRSSFRVVQADSSSRAAASLGVERGVHSARADGDAPDRASFRGVHAEYSSREAVSLEVKTDDGDTVSISFEALNRVRAGVYSARANGRTAGQESVSAESAFEAKVQVKGTLDDEEARQIAELLQSLVTTARSAAPQPVRPGGLESLDSFQFAYRSYHAASLETLNARIE